MQIKTIVNMDMAASMHRYLTLNKPQSFTGADTLKIGAAVIGSIFPELTDQERGAVFQVVSALMDYAALDGFQEGLNTGRAAAQKLK